MKLKKYRLILTGLLAIVLLYGCAGAGKDSFVTGQDLSKGNRWDDAIVYFEKALKEEPDNQEYKDALLNAKQQAAKIHYDKARRALAATPEPNMPSLEQVSKEVDTAYNLDPKNNEIRSFNNNIKEKIEGLQGTVKSLYSQAELDMQKEDWGAAVTKLRQVNKLFPSYEDTGNRLAKAEQEGAKLYYQQGVELSKQDDWRMAAQAFKSAMDLNPNYYDVASLYREAQSKDNADYLISEAEKAGRAQKWDRAILLYDKAREYQPENRDLLQKLDSLRSKAAQLYFEDAGKLVRQGMFYNALKKVELIKNYNPSIESDPIFKEFTKNFCTKLMDRADKYTEKEMWGNALVWYQKIEGLNPNYPELFQKVLDTKDRINKRTKKSIAVFDFGSPSNDKDAGKIAANKLITYLHKNASGDLRIIERENLQSILREMQLGQTGIVDTKAAQALGKMRGIDTFIMGDVLHYSARMTDTPSTNQVKVLVDEEDVRNPEFSDWLMMHQKPTEEDWKSAPPRTVKKRNYQFISYRSGSAKINAMIEISYKLVDTTTGENISTNTIPGKLEKADKYSDAVPAANITYDPQELPTEAEVLDELTNQKISELGQAVLKNFQSLEVGYFNEAQQQQKRRNVESAIEKYIDAVYDEKSKGISTPISQKSIETIERLIQDK